MGLLRQILGLCDTKPPVDPACWHVDGDAIKVELSRAPDLLPLGGAVRLEGESLGKLRLLLVRGGDGTVRAFKNKCSHAGRRLDPIAGEPRVRCCSIGGSTFDYDGKRLSGLAQRPVRMVEVDEKDGVLVIRKDELR